MKNNIASTLLCLFTLFFGINAKAQYNNNYSASFNGTTSYLTMPQTDGDMQLHDPFTIELWVKPKAYPASGGYAMLFQKANPNNIYGIYISMDSEGLIGAQVNGNYYTTPAPAMIGFWTHIAVVYDNINLRIFFNSAEVVTQPLAAGDVYQPYPTYIGAMKTQAGTMVNFYKGEIDELRVWDIVRGFYDIENYYHQSYTGMGSAYSSLRISLPFNNNFTDHGGKEFNTVTNNKVKFIDHRNENAEYVAYNSSLWNINNTPWAPDHNDLDASSAVTIEYWLRLKGGYYGIVYKGDGGSMNYFLQYGNEGSSYYVRFLYSTSGNVMRTIVKNIPSSIHISPASWNHIAATYKSSTGNVKLYFNGSVILDTIVVAGETLAVDDRPLIIDAINGCYDEIRIWKNTVRTATQIKNDMFKGYNYTMNPLPANVTVYDFDGRMDDVMKPIADSAKTIYLAGGPVYYRTFDHFPKASNPQADRSTAPLLRDDKNYFGDNTKYVTSAKKIAAPLLNQAQTITDSLFVSQTGNISDVKVYVLADVTEGSTFLNDGVSQAIKLTLTSPTGKQVQLTPNYTTEYLGKNMYCVFDMSAEKKISYDNYYGVVLPPFSPEIKPYQSLTARLQGKPVHGWWKLKLEAPAITSFSDVELLGWGIYPIISAGMETSEENVNAAQEKSFVTASVFPNPVLQTATISYQLTERSDVNISVIDATGKTVTVVLNKKDEDAGLHRISFDGSKLTSGIYFCRIVMGNKTETIKIVKQ